MSRDPLCHIKVAINKLCSYYNYILGSNRCFIVPCKVCKATRYIITYLMHSFIIFDWTYIHTYVYKFDIERFQNKQPDNKALWVIKAQLVARERKRGRWHIEGGRQRGGECEKVRHWRPLREGRGVQERDRERERGKGRGRWRETLLRVGCVRCVIYLAFRIFY